jgi:hypothetical protein
LLKDILDMNYKIVAQIILFFSSLGLGSLIISKISQLNTLPEAVAFEGTDMKVALKRRFRGLTILRNLSPDVFLQKFLIKIRILSKRADSKASVLLKKLKEDTQKKKITEDDDYWDKVKATQDNDK